MGKDQQEHGTHHDVLKAGKMRGQMTHSPGTDLAFLKSYQRSLSKMILL